MLKKGFTLIELLIVISIISALVAIQAFAYINSQRSARDSKRKTDLENIRAALEQYRSNNNTYPNASKIVFNKNCTKNSTLQDSGGNIYMSPLPSDPYCQLYFYYYTALPIDCNETTIFCTDYALGAKVEKSSTCSVAGTNCANSGVPDCNYCLGPYGEK